MIKCRVAGNKDDDFIEVEVALPTFSNLLQSCCEELQINSDCVYMLRKLPNVVIVFNANVHIVIFKVYSTKIYIRAC